MKHFPCIYLGLGYVNSLFDNKIMLLITSNSRGLKLLLIVGKSFLYCGKFYNFVTGIFQKIIAC